MRYLLLFLGLCFVISATAQRTSYFPAAGASWQEKDPESLGLDGRQLKAAVEFAQANEYSEPRDLRRAILKGFEREPYHKIVGPTKKRGGPAGMILKDGYCVAKWGDTRRVEMTFSVTKSYLSTLVGLAVDAGLIGSVGDTVAHYVWDGTFEGEHNGQITWEHLMEQSSDWSGTLWGVPDWADRPPREGNIDDWRARPLNAPGAVFEYNDVRVNVLAYALLQVWRKPLPQVLKENIMDPIGASTTWRWYGYETSWTNVDGQYVQSVSGGGHSGGGLFISTEDQARFGLLFLNHGNWDGQTCFPAHWVEAVTTPSAPNPNYGYMWWLNADGPRQWENVSKDLYYAAGFGGNFIVVDPNHNMVIVTRWLEPSQIGEMVRQVQAALQ